MTKFNKRLFILENIINDSVFKQYAKLILTLGHLEWFLQEVLIFIILKTQFNQTNNNNKGHVILGDLISKLSFDKKIDLIKQNNLLNAGLMRELDSIRKRRNIFIHGIIIEENKNMFIKIFHKKLQENFNVKNISDFLDFVEITGGKLVSEFESQGFKLVTQ